MLHRRLESALPRQRKPLGMRHWGVKKSIWPPLQMKNLKKQHLLVLTRLDYSKCFTSIKLLTVKSVMESKFVKCYHYFINLLDRSGLKHHFCSQASKGALPPAKPSSCISLVIWKTHLTPEMIVAAPSSKKSRQHILWWWDAPTNGTQASLYVSIWSTSHNIVMTLHLVPILHDTLCSDRIRNQAILSTVGPILLINCVAHLSRYTNTGKNEWKEWKINELLILEMMKCSARDANASV